MAVLAMVAREAVTHGRKFDVPPCSPPKNQITRRKNKNRPKVLTHDQYYAKGYGRIVEYPDAQIAGFSEEHGNVDLAASARKPKVGEVVSVIPNHCCVVTNMVDEVYGVRGGKVEVVWPVAARGRVR
jgi:hypothetical protein